eukprot:1309925-Pyramimonas_sp.AAC.1
MQCRLVEAFRVTPWLPACTRMAVSSFLNWRSHRFTNARASSCSMMARSVDPGSGCRKAI